jgi:TonB family protein
LINDQLIGWTVESGRMNTVTSSAGTLTVTEQAGWVHPSLTFASGTAVNFDLRTSSSTGRALLILGGTGPITRVRGYTLTFPNGSRPVHQDAGLTMLEVDPDVIADSLKTSADWTHYEIRFDADRVTVAVDDHRVVDQREPTIASGWLGIRAEAGSVMLRNLRVEPWPKGVPIGAGFVQIGATVNTRGVEFGPWFRRFITRVRENAVAPDAVVSGRVVVMFNVRKNGSIADMSIISPSPLEDLNRAASDALMASSPFQPLPADYPDDHTSLTVTFDYNDRAPR